MQCQVLEHYAGEKEDIQQQRDAGRKRHPVDAEPDIRDAGIHSGSPCIRHRPGEHVGKCRGGIEAVYGSGRGDGWERRKFDYVVSRGVTDLEKLAPMARRNISPRHRNKLPNGLICLKGGDLTDEVSRSGASRDLLEQPLSEWFAEPFFETKKLIYLPC